MVVLCWKMYNFSLSLILNPNLDYGSEDFTKRCRFELAVYIHVHIDIGTIDQK